MTTLVALYASVTGVQCLNPPSDSQQGLVHGDISKLVIRTEIDDLINRYSTAIDTRDWSLFKSIFTPNVTIDYGPLVGQFDSSESFTDFMEKVHEPAGPSIHRMTNTVVNFTEPLSARTYGESIILNANNTSQASRGLGYYDDVFALYDGELRIASRFTNIILYEQLTLNRTLS